MSGASNTGFKINFLGDGVGAKEGRLAGSKPSVAVSADKMVPLSLSESFFLANFKRTQRADSGTPWYVRLVGVSAKLAGCARWVQHLVEQKADLEVLETLFAKDEISRPALLALVMNSISILELVIFLTPH